MPEKQHELDHVAVEIDVTTAVTAVEDDVTSSTAASSSLTSPASQAQKHERQPLSPGPYSVRGAYAFLRLNSTTIFQVFWSSGYPIWSFTADWLHREDASQIIRRSKTFCRYVLILGYEHFLWSEYFECGNRHFRFVFAKNQNLTTPCSAIFQSAYVANMIVSFPNICIAIKPTALRICGKSEIIEGPSREFNGMKRVLTDAFKPTMIGRRPPFSPFQSCIVSHISIL